MRAVIAAVIGIAVSAGAVAGGSATRYGGLGATVKAFYAQNSHGPGSPPLGAVYFHIDRVAHGRVIAYDIKINATPPFSARERVAMSGGINVPLDATETSLNGTYCIVWHSKELGKLIGFQYAAATTTPQDRTTAFVHAERRPRC